MDVGPDNQRGFEMTKPASSSRKHGSKRQVDFFLNKDPNMVHNPLFTGKVLKHAPQSVDGFKVSAIAFLMFVLIPASIVLFFLFHYPEAFSNYLDRHFMTFFAILLIWCGIFHFGLFSLNFVGKTGIDL